MLRAGLVGVVVMGCATPRPDRYAELAARYPTAVTRTGDPFGSPWVLGRKVTVRLDDAYETTTIAAIDTCGTWIQSVRITADQHIRLLVCVAAVSAPAADPRSLVRSVRTLRDGQRVDDDQGLLGRTLARVFAWPVEGIVVGVEDPRGATGLIQRLVRADVPEPRSGRHYVMEFGMGFASDDAYSATSVGFGIATAITERLEIGALGRVFSSPSAGAMQVTARVDLVQHRAFALHARLAAGIGEFVSDDDTPVRGGVVGGALGVRLPVGRDWSLNAELRDDVFLPTKTLDVGHAVQFVLGADLHY